MVGMLDRAKSEAPVSRQRERRCQDARELQLEKERARIWHDEAEKRADSTAFWKEKFRLLELQSVATIRILESQLAEARQRNSDLAWALEASQEGVNENERIGWK